MRKYRFVTAVAVLTILVTGCGTGKQEIPVETFPAQTRLPEENSAVEIRYNTYDTLNVATYLTKIGDTYYLADCYHNQIIYHDNLTAPLTEWKILTDEVHYAHTIAGDGTVLLVDDTENNRLLTFTRQGEGYVQSQIFENAGMKPHFVQYDDQREQFLAWSSITGEMFYLKRNQDTNELYIDKTLQIPELYGVYVRSFTIMGDEVYLVSGHNNEQIICADIDTMAVKKSYTVPDEIAGMVQLVKIQDYYYITVSTDNTENQDYATIIRCAGLEDLSAGVYEDVYSDFGISGGTPYYITQIEDRYYMAHHRTAQNIIAFDVIGNEICNVEVIY